MSGYRPGCIDFILGSLSGETKPPWRRRARRAPALVEAAVDGLPDGAVFTVEEAADILKVPAETVEQMVRERAAAGHPDWAARRGSRGARSSPVCEA